MAALHSIAVIILYRIAKISFIRRHYRQHRLPNAKERPYCTIRKTGDGIVAIYQILNQV